MLNETDFKTILKKFPKFELSYEINAHKKVHNAHAVLAIPEGKKYIAWFTTFKNENECLLFELDEQRIPINCSVILTSFTDQLSSKTGTIFYGTLFKHQSNDCFCIEDIYYYLGNPYINISYSTKLETLNNIFKNNISQSALNKQFTIFGIPLMSFNSDFILSEINKLPYKISCIKFRFFEQKNTKKIMVMKNYSLGLQKSNTHSKKNTIFKITADIEPDIYNLFAYKDGIEEFYDNAFIPDYKTSVMMNKLFRNIKENDNLDAIEESDNEDEFEDCREDKYVYLDRTYKMICEYSYKFKKWIPLSLANENDKIVSMSVL